MQAVIVEGQSFPPGCVVMATGDITRYAVSMQCYSSLRVPPGSLAGWNSGVLIAKSLNDGLETMMARPDLQWVWIMGDDHTYHPDTLFHLLAHEKDAIIPLCLNRYPPFSPTVINHTHDRMKYLSELPMEGLYKLADDETCGDAGLLIRRNVLEATGPEWYETKKSGMLTAEDQQFTQKIKAAGFDIFLDTGTIIGHCTVINVRPVHKDDHWEIRLLTPIGQTVCDLISRDGTG